MTYLRFVYILEQGNQYHFHAFAIPVEFRNKFHVDLKKQMQRRTIYIVKLRAKLFQQPQNYAKKFTAIFL